MTKECKTSSSQRTPSPRAVASARAAVIASVGNMLDAQLQTRASGLHGGAAALERQRREVDDATAGLRRERQRLEREAEGATRRIKELGDVQNWAEVLERELLVLEETARLARSEASSSCGCSECEEGGASGEARGKERGDGGEVEAVGHDGENESGRDADASWSADGSRSVWSEASRSLTEPHEVSSLGTERIKTSDTTSPSTASFKDNDAKPFGFL